MYSVGRYCGYGAISVHILIGIVAYQFDVDNVVLYKNVASSNKIGGSYFGYSVALWNESSKKSWILIGAPRANSALYEDTTESGTAFKCDILDKSCRELLVGRHPEGKPEKGAWLGGSITIGRDRRKDIVLVCAPRWEYIREKKTRMSGMCYLPSAKTFAKSNYAAVEKLRPLFATIRKYEHGLNAGFYNTGQCGFSTHIVPDRRSLQYVLGCPGAYGWHGTPILYSNDESKTSFFTPAVMEGDSVTNNSYSGYAVTSGLYFGSQKRMYVTGAPRGNELRGRIILFDFQKGRYDKTIVETNISRTGDQIGEYFGSALTSCDINGDGRDDLLVGAPQWSKDSDEGRIYIFSAKESSTDFDHTQYIDGVTFQGRFGSAITCLGDIDYDGFHDVAVGAPYDGNGTVYIYHGAKDGLRRTQNITAPKDTKGFGISISEPRDIDNNGYADIAVGAYLSDHVTVFRSKRVVNMKVTLSSSLSGKLYRHGSRRFVVLICSSYDGKNAPEKLNVTKELKIDEFHHRAELIDIKGNPRMYKFSRILMKSNSSCENFTISIKETNEDFINPITVSVIQRLNTLETGNDTSKNENFYKFSAVTNETHQEVQSHLEIPFALDYGNDTIFNSNLSIHMMTDLKDASRYVIGSAPYIKLDIGVTNTGDQAYRTQAVVVIPKFIQLRVIPPTCRKEEMSNEIICICDIDNPLNRNDTKNVSLVLDMSRVSSDIKQFHLNATAKTQSNDSISGDHETSLLINCVAVTDIGIAGNADRDSYRYTLESEKEQLQTIMFQHIYEITNYEKTLITEALLSVSIPTHWIHGGREIEIVKVNKTTGDLDELEFDCMDTVLNVDISSSRDDAFTMTKPLICTNSSLRIVPQDAKQFPLVKGKIFDASLDNRTLQINCTNPSFKCKTIHCKLGPFQSARSIAKLVLTFNLLLPNFKPEIIQKKDIIFFVANASTRITKPLDTIQSVNNKPDSILIGTMFIETKLKYQLASYLIPLSVSVGLLLLIFIILGLLKLGFFKRTKKIELEAILKEKDNMTPTFVLETTSSTEALDLR